MLKPQMLEAIFVAGCVLAGLTGQARERLPARLTQHGIELPCPLPTLAQFEKRILGVVDCIIDPRRAP